MKIFYNAKTIKQGHLNLLLYYVTVKFSTYFGYLTNIPLKT